MIGQNNPLDLFQVENDSLQSSVENGKTEGTTAATPIAELSNFDLSEERILTRSKNKRVKSNDEIKPDEVGDNIIVPLKKLANNEKAEPENIEELSHNSLTKDISDGDETNMVKLLENYIKGIPKVQSCKDSLTEVKHADIINEEEDKINKEGQNINISFPSIFVESNEKWFRVNEIDDWLVYTDCTWLYNINTELYYHVSSENMYYLSDAHFVKIEFPSECVPVKEENEAIIETTNTNEMKKEEINKINDINEEENNKIDEMNEEENNKINEMNEEDNINMIEINDINKHNKIKIDNKQESVNMYDAKNLQRTTSKDIHEMTSLEHEESRTVSNNENDKNKNKENKMSTTESDDETFSMTLEDNLVCGTYSLKGQNKKSENEDCYITKDFFDLNDISDGEGLCFLSAVFDGHGGSYCAQYVMKHLKTNIIAKFKQSYISNSQKIYISKKKESDIQSTEMKSLCDSVIKAFDMTDKNYMDYSKKHNLEDGATACVVLIYGPDEDGTLKVLCANCGDSGAILCQEKKAICLSRMHRLDLVDERMRILKSGGRIANIQGEQRIITETKKKFANQEQQMCMALSTSRSFGDIQYKKHQPLVLSKPDISMRTIDFDKDSFLILATDGVLAVLTPQEIVDVVWKNRRKSPQEAAKAVVQQALQKNPKDDKTCTVIFFYWREDVFQSHKIIQPLNSIETTEENNENINMFEVYT